MEKEVEELGAVSDELEAFDGAKPSRRSMVNAVLSSAARSCDPWPDAARQASLRRTKGPLIPSARVA